MDGNVRFSIIVVSLNAGERLRETINSIINQTYGDYEIILKDGGSVDGSVEALLHDSLNNIRKFSLEEKTEYESKAIKIYRKKDAGIYDAMNQAIGYANGDYYLFLNTGDNFFSNDVLQKVNDALVKLTVENKETVDIIYGDMYHKALESVIASAPEINDFTCYRNVPCHQTCFYSSKMFEDRAYNQEYNVRADYEHFLWCFYEKKANIRHIPVNICTYEGGGYSETPENLKRSAIQHREIVVKYMGKKKANHYRRIMLLTLQPIRTKMAESKLFSGLYNSIKQFVYKR